MGAGAHHSHPLPEARDESAERSLSDLYKYLESAFRPSGVVALLLLVCGLEWSNPARAVWLAVTLGLACVAAVHLYGRARWIAYAFLAVIVSVVSVQRIYVDAIPLDAASDRDECAETAVRGLLAGTDPWAKPTFTGNPVTTGPADTLLLAPFVAAFGRIEEAAFAFWIVVLGIMAAADIRRRNSTFESLALVYVAGLFGIADTQKWSLDELYFALPLFVIAWRLAGRGRWLAVGAALGTMALWRLNYALGIVGFLAWLVTQGGRARALAGIACGAALTTALICVPFIVRPTSLFGRRSPLVMAFQYGLARPDLGVADLSVGHALVGLLPAGISPAVELALKLALALGLVALVALALRFQRLDHPFWHVSFAGYFAHTVLWRTTDGPDYTLMFVLPALFAIAWHRPSSVASPCRAISANMR